MLTMYRTLNQSKLQKSQNDISESVVDSLRKKIDMLEVQIDTKERDRKELVEK